MVSYIFFWPLVWEIKARPYESILAESRRLDAGLLIQVCKYVVLVSFWLLFWGCSLALLILHLPTTLITIWFPEVKWCIPLLSWNFLPSCWHPFCKFDTGCFDISTCTGKDNYGKITASVRENIRHSDCEVHSDFIYVKMWNMVDSISTAFWLMTIGLSNWLDLRMSQGWLQRFCSKQLHRRNSLTGVRWEASCLACLVYVLHGAITDKLVGLNPKPPCLAGGGRGRWRELWKASNAECHFILLNIF